MESEYFPRILSDHSPLTLSIEMPEKMQNMYRWHLNPTLLKKTDFVNLSGNKFNYFVKQTVLPPLIVSYYGIH